MLNAKALIGRKVTDNFAFQIGLPRSVSLKSASNINQCLYVIKAEWNKVVSVSSCADRIIRLINRVSMVCDI